MLKKETPRACRGAGLIDGFKTVGSDAGKPTTGREKRQSAVRKSEARLPGTLIQVSQVALNRPRRDHAIGWAKSDGSAPASKIVGGIGTARPFGGGCRPMPSAQALTIQQDSKKQCSL